MRFFHQLLRNSIMMISFILFLISFNSGLGLIRFRFSRFMNCMKKSNIELCSQVFKRGSANYSYYNYQWNLYPYEKKPYAYVLPKNEAEVAKILKCAVRSRIALFAKSGGHSLEKYSYGNNRKSVVMDLRLLQWVELRGNEAIVGGGTLSGYMNWKLWEYGRVFVPSGECPTVGVAGLTLGGGFNNIVSRSVGLSQDFLKRFNIVTTKGQILKVDENHYSDLFWALRGGGGGNFGIVTQMTFSVTPSPNITFGRIEYPLGLFPEVFRTFQNLIDPEVSSKVPSTLNLELVVMQSGIHLYFFDTKGFNMDARKIGNLFSNGSNYTLKTTTYIENVFLRTNMLKTLYEFQPNVKFERPSDLENLDQNSLKQVFHKRKSFFVYRKINNFSIKKLSNFLQKMPVYVQIYLQFFGSGVINKYSRTETAFVHRGDNYIMHFPISMLKNQFNPIQNQIHQAYQYELDLLTRNIFKHNNETYQNYIQGDLYDYASRYYGENLKRLIRIKRKYDPKNYFRFPQAIPYIY